MVTILHCKATLDHKQPGLMRWLLVWINPQVQDDRSTCDLQSCVLRLPPQIVNIAVRMKHGGDSLHGDINRIAGRNNWPLPPPAAHYSARLTIQYYSWTMANPHPLSTHGMLASHIVNHHIQHHRLDTANLWYICTCRLNWIWIKYKLPYHIY